MKKSRTGRENEGEEEARREGQGGMNTKKSKGKDYKWKK